MNVSLQGSLKKQHLVGRGKYAELKDIVRSESSANAIFLNVDVMTASQHTELSSAWQLPIYDRFGVHFAAVATWTFINSYP